MAEGADKSKQFLKVAAVVAGIFLLAAVAVVVRMNSKPDAPASVLPPVPEAQVERSATTPEYRRNIDELNEQKRQEAAKNNTSALPVFSPRDESLKGKGEAQPGRPGNTAYVSDLEMQQRAQREQARAASVTQQLTQLMTDWHPPKSANAVLAQSDSSAAKAAADQSAQAVKTSATTSQSVTLAIQGDRYFGTLLTPIDTDKLGLVIATIDSGPFAGGEVSGTAKRVDETVSIQFTSMKWNRRSYAIQAAGIEIATFNSMLSGEVDSKWMARFGWPFVAALVSGFGQAASMTSTTTTVGLAGVTVAATAPSSRQITAAAIGQGAQAVGQQLSRSQGNLEKRVTIPAQQPIAIYFLKDLVDDGKSGQVVTVDQSQVAQAAAVASGQPVLQQQPQPMAARLPGTISYTPGSAPVVQVPYGGAYR